MTIWITSKDLTSYGFDVRNASVHTGEFNQYSGTGFVAFCGMLEAPITISVPSQFNTRSGDSAISNMDGIKGHLTRFI
jgi:hypothetical protein